MMNQHIEEIWRTKEEAAFAGGGKSKIEKQIAAGKKTARDRLNLLLDADSFQ
jgi:acetyl-CoA carboxylase carboxyltransferase component